MNLGVIVNPIAGLGGTLGLKGTDGPLGEVAASQRSDRPALQRVARAFSALRSGGPSIRLSGAGGSMGAAPAAAAGLPFKKLYEVSDLSGPEDTLTLAERLMHAEVEMILFAGGDGTARDILGVVGTDVPVLGIPCGVKMHSGVFARSARDAGELMAALAKQPPERRRYVTADVVDREEGGAPALFGAMRVPADPRRMQPSKSSGSSDAAFAMADACAVLAEQIHPALISVIGPGSTTYELKQAISPGGTLMGVDVYRGRRLCAADANEADILTALDGSPARIVLGVVGGQGFLLGRGNQQISPAVVRRVGRSNIVALASADKIASLPHRSLFADTGDEALDLELAAYVPVLVGRGRRMIVPLNAHLLSDRSASSRGAA